MSDAGPTPGPSPRDRARNPERSYTGPAEPGAPRSPAEYEAHFKRLAAAGEGPPFPRFARLVGVGGWVVGGAATVYMMLYADFGDKEHVFSPVRRAFHKYTNELFTLSPSERNTMGLSQPLRVPPPAQLPKDEQRPS